jgi:LacI family transcriptional regulator
MSGKGSTLMDVARAADVSIASASRAINGLDNVTAEVRARVLEAATKLRYVPHWGARSLAMNRTNTIGLLLPDIYGEFFSEIIRGVDVAARARGLHLLVSGSHGDLNEAVAAVRAMGGRVDGLLIMSPFVDSQDLAAVLPLNLPMVTIASRIGTLNHSAITVDNYEGGVMATRHLIEGGARRVAHISGPDQNFEAQERKRGYADVIAAVLPGVSPRVYEGDFTEESGYAGVQAFLAQSFEGGDGLPDAIFAGNDMMAVGALLALKEAGRRVPDDVAVVGFDDIPIARFTSPPLSTLRVGVYEMGRQGLEMLVAAFDETDAAGPRSVVISPELVVRGSSGNRGQT